MRVVTACVLVVLVCLVISMTTVGMASRSRPVHQHHRQRAEELREAVELHRLTQAAVRQMLATASAGQQLPPPAAVPRNTWPGVIEGEVDDA